MTFEEIRRFVDWPVDSISFQRRNTFAATPTFNEALRPKEEKTKNVATIMENTTERQQQQSTQL